jgi:hypothetical protein
MYVDKQNELSDSQAVTTTAISTNVIDLTNGQSGLTTIDIGSGEDVFLVIQVDTAATAAGAATVTFSLESDSTADLATSATVHWTSAAIGKATLVAGYEVARIKLPAGDYERYLGLRYTVATGPLTAGAFSAFLTTGVHAQKNYGSAFTVA